MNLRITSYIIPVYVSAYFIFPLTLLTSAHYTRYTLLHLLVPCLASRHQKLISIDSVNVGCLGNRCCGNRFNKASSHAAMLSHLFILTHCLAKIAPVKVIHHTFWMQYMHTAEII